MWPWWSFNVICRFFGNHKGRWQWKKKHIDPRITGQGLHLGVHGFSPSGFGFKEPVISCESKVNMSLSALISCSILTFPYPGGASLVMLVRSVWTHLSCTEYMSTTGTDPSQGRGVATPIGAGARSTCPP